MNDLTLRLQQAHLNLLLFGARSRMHSLAVGLSTLFVGGLLLFCAGSAVGNPRPVLFAVVISMIIAVHELGHCYILETHGIKSEIIFLGFAGITSPYPYTTNQVETLPYHVQGQLWLAGVVSQHVLVLGATMAYLLGFADNEAFVTLMDYHAAVVVFNLFPLGGLDGGQFTRLLIKKSLRKEEGKWVLYAMGGVAISYALLGQLFLTSVPPLLLFFPLLAWQLYRRPKELGDIAEPAVQPSIAALHRLGIAYIAIISLNILLFAIR